MSAKSTAIILGTAALALCAVVYEQDQTIKQQRALIRLQMKDSLDLTLCRVGLIQQKMRDLTPPLVREQ